MRSSNRVGPDLQSEFGIYMLSVLIESRRHELNERRGAPEDVSRFTVLIDPFDVHRVVTPRVFYGI